MDTKPSTPVQKKGLPLIKSTASFEIHIPREVENKIRYLCNAVHDVEWSGTLFYTYSGSLEDGSFKVTCVDLFVMDIGSSAYTEFKESADVINYRCEHDLLDENIMEGLIHSHNNMGTFFSATDCGTLIEEGTNTNHFVSLIVNNAGSYTAAVTRRVTLEKKVQSHIKSITTKYYNTYGNDTIVLERDNVQEEDKEETTNTSFIEYFDLKVIKESSPYHFEDIANRLAEIKRNKSTYTKTWPYPSQTARVSYNDKPKSSYPSCFDDYDDYDDLTAREGYHVENGILVKNTFQSKKEETPEEKKENEEKENKDNVPTIPSGEVPLCLQETFDEALTKHLVLQLLTGSIIINDKAIDPAEWVKKMDAIYEKRFGILDPEEHPTADEAELTKNNCRLETWIEVMAEFLVYTRDEDLLTRLNAIKEETDAELDESDTAEVCAFSMWEYLGTLPGSYVKDIMMNTLYTYIPDGVEKYI